MALEQTFVRTLCECRNVVSVSSQSRNFRNYGMYEKLVLVVFDHLFYEMSHEFPVLIVLLGLVVVERMVQPELCQYALVLIYPGILFFVHFPLPLFCCCGRL